MRLRSERTARFMGGMLRLDAFRAQHVRFITGTPCGSRGVVRYTTYARYEAGSARKGTEAPFQPAR